MTIGEGLGQAVMAQDSLQQALLSPDSWDLPRRPSTIREVIEDLDPLLEAVCLRLGPLGDRHALIEQLAVTLRLHGRESSLPLAHITADDETRFELARQARDIGDFIVGTVREISISGASQARHGSQTLSQLVMRSRCDGHLWHPDVTAQLTGPWGGPVVMQLYNEWLHQIILLRDILMPFANWQTLPIPLDRLTGDRGLRPLERARSSFVGELLVRQIENTSILSLAQAVFGLEPVEDCYGFVAGAVVVLPAAVGDAVERPGSVLLRWQEASITGLASGATARFVYASDDYFAEGRSALGEGSSSPQRQEASAHIEARPIADGEALLDLVVVMEEKRYCVDLGQALRGHRFAYRPDDSASCSAEGAGSLRFHSLCALFALPGMATAAQGTHVFFGSGDPLVDLAILGKVYPENTIIRGAANWSAVARAGKGYGARIVLERAVDN